MEEEQKNNFELTDEEQRLSDEILDEVLKEEEDLREDDYPEEDEVPDDEIVYEIPFSKTKREFRSYIERWLKVTDEEHVCRIKEYAELNDKQERWLVDCIREIEGEDAAEYYVKYISFFYNTLYKRERPDVLMELCRSRCNVSYVESLESVCFEHWVCCNENSTADLEAVFDVYEELLPIVAGSDIWEYWLAAHKLSKYYDKPRFMKFLTDFKGGTTLSFCLFVDVLLKHKLDFLSSYLNLNEQQIKWVKERMAEEKKRDGDGPSPVQTDTDELFMFDKEVRERARKHLTQATEKGLIEKTDNGYKWADRYSKELLAVFCAFMCDALEMNTGKQLVWKPFETLFRRAAKSLRQDFNKWKEKDGKSIGYKLIADIFPEQSEKPWD